MNHTIGYQSNGGSNLTSPIIDSAFLNGLRDQTASSVMSIEIIAYSMVGEN